MIPSRSEINQLHAQLCSALSDPIRITILYALAEQPLNVSQLTEHLQAPQSTVSRHLGILRASGLVTFTRLGRQVQYTLADHRTIEALDTLREILHDRASRHANLLESPR
jgi:ArsR family transcriptional regulator